jgi:5-methylthioadenosine/S-adenosylhomocysteine deaminase
MISIATHRSGRYNRLKTTTKRNELGTVLTNIRPVETAASTRYVRFEGNTVETISDSDLPRRRGDDVINAGGKLAFPGFVNAHTHLAMVLFRGLADDVPLHAWLTDYVWPIERQLQPEDVYWSALLALAEGIRGGTVAFADMYFHVDAVAEAVAESGARALLSYGVIAPSLDDRGRAELAATRAFIERWHGAADGRIRVAISPHSVYTCGEDVWREAIAMARSYDVSIHTHVAETRREVADWQRDTGSGPVPYLQRIGAFAVPFLAAHCVHVDAHDIAILAEHGAHVVHCPKSNAKLGSGIAPVNEMRTAGVGVAIGTDGAASNNRLDMMEEMRAVWMMQRARHEDPTSPTAEDVVAMATEEGRRALGVRPGGLSKAGAADVVLLDADRLHSTPPHDPIATMAYASNGLDVTDVIVDGRVLMRNGELLTIDEERVKAEVTRLLRKYKT